jgi:putative chitinase
MTMQQFDRDYFFDVVRASLFHGSLSQSQVDGMNYILDQWDKLWEANFPRGDKRHLAYCLATVYHETGQAMRPVEEWGKGEGHSYGQPTGPYDHCYYGRGHVQLTWEDNYIAGTERLKPYGLDADLHQHPELMLEDAISVTILFDGMRDGWWTGVDLDKYINDATEDPVNARRVVNGTDKADTIAGYYWKFKDALQPAPAEPERPTDGPQMEKPRRRSRPR